MIEIVYSYKIRYVFMFSEMVTTLHCIVVERKDCQRFREILGDAKIFDKKRRVSYEANNVILPILREPDLETKEKLNAISKFTIFENVQESISTEIVVPDLKLQLQNQIRNLVPFQLTDDLSKEIPESWEYYGDLLLLPGNAFLDEVWTKFMSDILRLLCDLFKVARVARKRAVINDGFRSPKTDLLLGTNTWVCRKENGINYNFDITKSMFCAGNISEKIRISKFDCFGEVVVDLFAGIGYFTLPYLVHAKADHVFACEWNPVSVEALKYNLHQLNLEHKCTVLEGDNRVVCPKNVADRINLGLIPESGISWRTACEALKDVGGILHVHGNVECGKEDIKKEKLQSWAISISETISTMLIETKKRRYSVDVLHVECVKSYAPRIYHAVADLQCS